MSTAISYTPRSKYESSHLSMFNIAGYAFLFLLISISLVHAIIISVRFEVLQTYGATNFIRAEQLAFQIHKGLELAESKNYEFCSDEDLKHLRKIKSTYFFLDDIGRVSGNKILCTVEKGMLDSTINVGPVEITSDKGFEYRNSQTDLIRNEKNKPIITYQNSVVFVSSAYLHLSKYGHFKVNGMAGVTYQNLGSRYVYSFFGNLLPNQIEPSVAHKNTLSDWLPLPNNFITMSQCNGIYNICITAIDTRPGLYAIPLTNLIIILTVLIALSFAFGYTLENFRVGPKAFARRLKSVIYQDNIYPVYQPQINIETKEVVGVESLARWDDSTLGMISPEIFIRVAEDSGLIEKLTKKITNKIFLELSDVLEANRSFTVSLNISTQLLTSDTFINFINDAVSQYKFNRNQVILEVTERTDSEKGKMASFSKKLKEQGYQVSIDDFGTGVSNLSWLSTLEPNEIKVDKTFTQSIEEQTVTSITLEGIFSMLEHLQVKVVFEGIETEQQRDYIFKRVPKSIGQGWLFAKPKEIDELKEFLDFCFNNNYLPAN
ncbi:MAG: EAL domain-containing protein [Candidatus Thiodiazotropha sp. 6PLUC9]